MFKKFSLTRIIWTNIFVVYVLFTVSCSKLGMGVIIWPPPDSDWKVGQVVKVRDNSYIRNTYIFDLPGQRKLKDEMEKWRLKLFDKLPDAQTYASELIPWADVYAECLYQGLPMRKQPSNLSERIYRFRQGDLIKILNQEPGPVQVGNLEGYWYKGISEGGIEGYVFDYYLNIVSIKNGKRTLIKEKVS